MQEITSARRFHRSFLFMSMHLQIPTIWRAGVSQYTFVFYYEEFKKVYTVNMALKEIKTHMRKREENDTKI